MSEAFRHWLKTFREEETVSPEGLRVSVTYKPGEAKTGLRGRYVYRMARENGARCCAEGHPDPEAAADCMAAKYREVNQ